MANQVVHFEVTGKDGPKLRDFYSKVFGWSFNVMPEMDYGTVDNGGRGINGGIGTSPNGASATFYIEVPQNPQATLDKIGTLGGSTTMPVMEIPDIVTLAQFKDPEGNLIGLVKSDDREMPPSQAQPAANPVTWFEIVGKDGPKLRDFYSKVFGWNFEMGPGEGMDYGMVTGQEGAAGGGVGTAPEPHSTFYVEVEDPQAMLDKIVASGGNVVMPVSDVGMVTLAMFTDPEGSLVGIYKPNQ